MDGRMRIKRAIPAVHPKCVAVTTECVGVLIIWGNSGAMEGQSGT